MSFRSWFKRAAPQPSPAAQRSLIEDRILGSYTYRQAPKRNAEELLKAYSSMPWLRAIVDKIARAAATAPFTLSVPTNAAGKSVRDRFLQRADLATRTKSFALLRKQARLRELDTHPSLDALDQGNSVMIGLNVRRVTQIHIELVGEAFWLFERNGAGMIIAIWPLPPHAVKRLPTPDHPFYEVDFHGWRDELPASEILHFVEPDPWDPYGRGIGIGGALGDELESGEYAGKTIKNFFFNDARPPILITADGLAPEETKRLEEGWLAKVSSFLNKYRPMFLNRKVDVKELSTRFDDMQLVELLKYFRDTEQQVFSIPPEMLGIITNSNRATIDACELLFARWLIVPRLEALRAHLQERYIPQFDERLVLGYASPVPADAEYEKSIMAMRPEAFELDEFRVRAGAEPLADGKGKVHLVPFSLVAVTDFDEISGGTLPQIPQPETGAPGSGDATAAKGAHLRVLRGGLATKAIRKEDLEQLLGVVDVRLLDRAIVPIVQETVRAFGVETTAETGISFTLDSPRVRQFLKTQSSSRIVGINDTTVDQLRATLSDGVGAGESTAELATRITDVFEEATGPRAFTIARTETGTASNFGAEEGIRQAGFEGKQWLAVQGDDRTRDAHKILDGTIVGIDEEFTFEGASAKYPGDFGIAELDINCVLPGTLVSGRFEGGLKAFYAGEAIEIQTDRGHRLTVTVNHPVLTTRGFVGAGALHEGDDVISQLLHIDRRAAARHDEKEHPPALIEEIFESFAARGPSRVCEPTRFDLDGDAMFCQGKVHLVGGMASAPHDQFRYPMLMNRAQAAAPQLVLQRQFITPDHAGETFPAAAMTSTPGAPGVRQLSMDGNRIVAHAPPLQGLRFTRGSGRNAMTLQQPGDRRPAHVERARDGQHALARTEAREHFLLVPDDSTQQSVTRVGPAADWNIRCSEQAKYEHRRGAEFARDLHRTLASDVAPDRIVALRRFKYVGHVYDLQTEPGWFMAGSIAIRNCRCTTLAADAPAKALADRVLRWKAYDRRRAAYERVMQSAVKRVFNIQRATLLDKLAQLGVESAA